MHLPIGRKALLLSPLLVLTACTTISWPIDWLGRSAQEDLNDRMQSALAPDIVAGRVTLQHLPDGASVTLADQTLFAADGKDLNDAGRDVLTAVIQSLVDPNLLHIAVAEPAMTPATMQAARVQIVTHYLERAGLGPTLVPPGAAPATAHGLTITVLVVQG